MGTWGTGLYSNDTASDVRDTCQEIFPFLSVEEGNAVLFKEYGQDLESKPKDDYEASFWYALADWQWKHGMLKEEIRQKAISLLEQYVGIEQWESDASSSDMKKRKKVLDTLRERLSKEQPPCKPPKAKLRKPWHKPGDIWIFRAPDSLLWTREGDGFRRIYYEQDGTIQDAGICAADNDWSFDLRNKYVAILCVETIQELHSKYIANVYDEDSVYAVYDFFSDEKPTVKELSSVGFLPSIVSVFLKDDLSMKEWFDPRMRQPAWHYKFSGYNKYSKNEYAYAETLHLDSEVVRFQQLASTSNANPDAFPRVSLCHISDFLKIKIVYERLGLNVNTLLDPTEPPMPIPTIEQKMNLDELKENAIRKYNERHGVL